MAARSSREYRIGRRPPVRQNRLRFAHRASRWWWAVYEGVWARPCHLPAAQRVAVSAARMRLLVARRDVRRLRKAAGVRSACFIGGRTITAGEQWPNGAGES